MVSNLVAKLLPVLLIALYFWHSSYYTKQEEKTLYNNVPDIKVYRSNTLLKDGLEIKGRNYKHILAKGKYLIEGKGDDVRKYYKRSLEQQGWMEISYYEIKDDNVHYGDGFVFEKGIYRIALDIYPPLNNKLNDFEMSFRLKNQKPYYWIFFGKKNMVFKEWRRKD